MSINRNQSLAVQNARSSKGDKKKGGGWFTRTSDQRVPDDDSSKIIDFATAIAAAALAVNSLGQSSITGKEKATEGHETSLAKANRKIEDTTAMQKPGEASMKISGGPDRIVSIKDATNGKMPEKAVDPALPISRTAKAADKISKEHSSSRKHDAAGTKNQSSTKIGEETKADIWEKAEMDKIKHRYEKLKGTIISWEKHKKKKARHQKDRTEAELDQIRAKATQHYNNVMRKIHQVAEAAKVNSKERRTHEESKVKEKANRMRMGKESTSCFCI